MPPATSTPFLTALAIGLTVLNLTLYLGLAATRQPVAWGPPQQTRTAAPPVAASLGTDPIGP